ncbi:MAG TPA: hypothetical protein VI389_04625 [Geobacteraceae bacterium]
MYRTLILCLCLVLHLAAMVVAEENGTNGPPAPGAPNEAGAPATPDAKTLRGMLVLGNNEAPMSLFIVPWKSSELGVEANLTRTLNERDVPVDRDVFLRELAFYEVSVGGKTK